MQIYIFVFKNHPAHNGFMYVPLWENTAHDDDNQFLLYGYKLIGS